MRRTTTVAIAVLLFAATAMSAHAATITVTNTNDSGAGSLRQALAVAHDGDSITFAVSGTITLTSSGLAVTKSVTISGPGADQLSIDGNQSPTQPVFSVLAIATISGLTIRNGQDGIENVGILTVRNCVISGNSSDGISNVTGTSLTVVSSNVSDNDGSGIGINVSDGGASATIVNTTVSGNSAGGIMTSAFFGGAAVTVTDSTISSNFGYGGIYGVLSLTVANSPLATIRPEERGAGSLLFRMSA